MFRLLWLGCLVVGCSKRAVPPLAAPPPSTAEVATGDVVQLAITGHVQLETRDVGDVAVALRERTTAAGGHVLHDQVTGADVRTARLVVRLPPDELEPMVAWLEGEGRLFDRSIEAEDVSGTIRDTQLRLRTLRTTLTRLEALLADGTVALSDVLEVEREITRVRTDIERLEWEAEHLAQRVSWARLTVELHGTNATFREPTARFHPGLQGRALAFPGAEPAPLEVGLGAVVHLDRSFTLDVAALRPVEEGRSTVLATAGFGTYSEYLGDGERRLLNPWLGLRGGGAWLDERVWWLAAVDLGLEVWRAPGLLVEVHARPTLLGSGGMLRPAVDAGLGVIVPF
jgi:hypothetical protein